MASCTQWPPHLRCCVGRLLSILLLSSLPIVRLQRPSVARRQRSYRHAIVQASLAARDVSLRSLCVCVYGVQSLLVAFVALVCQHCEHEASWLCRGVEQHLASSRSRLHGSETLVLATLPSVGEGATVGTIYQVMQGLTCALANAFPTSTSATSTKRTNDTHLLSSEVRGRAREESPKKDKGERRWAFQG